MIYESGHRLNLSKLKSSPGISPPLGSFLGITSSLKINIYLSFGMQVSRELTDQWTIDNKVRQLKETGGRG